MVSQSIGNAKTSSSARTLSPTGSPRTEGTTGSTGTVRVTGKGNTPRPTTGNAAGESGGVAAADQEVETDCAICCDNPRDTLLIPCYHIVVCAVCSPRVKKCLICKAQVESTIQVGISSLLLIICTYYSLKEI